jgi:hypothetical protein
MRKDLARAAAERLIRKAANLIRVNDQISAVDKSLIGVREKPTTLRKRECPKTPPLLRIVGARHGWQICDNQHLIRFADAERPHSRSKPEGADGLDLYVEVIGPGQPIPEAPSELYGWHPKHLGSHARSPIAVQYPKYQHAVRLVYWGRWMKLSGEAGRFSRPLVVGVDAFPTQPALPDRANRAPLEQTVFVTTFRRELPDHVRTIAAGRLLADENQEAA